MAWSLWSRHLRHEQEGPRYVYVPTADREKAQLTALRHLVSTFFGGSAERAMAALLDDEPGVDAYLREMRVRVAERLDRLAAGFAAMRADGLPVMETGLAEPSGEVSEVMKTMMRSNARRRADKQRTWAD